LPENVGHILSLLLSVSLLIQTYFFSFSETVIFFPQSKQVLSPF